MEERRKLRCRGVLKMLDDRLPFSKPIRSLHDRFDLDSSTEVSHLGDSISRGVLFPLPPLFRLQRRIGQSRKLMQWDYAALEP